jgi:hypothetical protein
MDALAEKQTAYNDAIAEEQKKVKELSSAYQDVANAANDVKKALDSIQYNHDNPEPDVSGFAERLMQHHWGSSSFGSGSSNSSSSAKGGGELAEYEKQKGEANLRSSVLGKLEGWMIDSNAQYLAG